MMKLSSPRTLFQHKTWLRQICSLVSVCFTVLTVAPPWGWTAMPMTAPQGAIPTVSSSGALLFGLEYNPQEPLLFEFFFDTSGLKEGVSLSKEEANRHIKYFLAALALPEDEKWVNLSEDEPDRIVPSLLGQTGLGRDMLVQDYLLKTMTAQMLNPETDVGARFWSRVYELAAQRYGTTDVPVNTFNRVWIMPERAVVYEKDGRGFVTEARLKVMLDEDYVVLRRRQQQGRMNADEVAANRLGTEVVREVVLPELERAVNESEVFAPVREIYRAAVLAAWYKRSLRQSVLGRLLADKGKIKGIDESGEKERELVYEAYLKTIKEGVFNLVKLEEDPATHARILRRYFSGGVELGFGEGAKSPKEGVTGLNLGQNSPDALKVRRGTPPAEMVPVSAAAVEAAIRMEKGFKKYNDEVLEALGKQLSPYLTKTGRVILLQGAGKVGEKLLRAFLEAGATVIVAETREKIAELKNKYEQYVVESHLFFVEEDVEKGTRRFRDPFEYWEKLTGNGQLTAFMAAHDNKLEIDYFVHAGVSSLDKEDIEALKKLGVKAIMGPANNILAAPELAIELHRNGILYLPDVLVNFGGVMGAVGGFFGLDLSPSEMYERAVRLTEKVLQSASEKNVSPWEALQEEIERYAQTLDVLDAGNRNKAPSKTMKHPFLLQGKTLAGEWKIERVYTAKEQLPPSVQDAWDDHYAVFQLRHQETKSVLFVAIHRLIRLNTTDGLQRLDLEKIRKNIPEEDYKHNRYLLTKLNDHYYAVGGTRFMSYPSEDEALKDALRLARAMTFKNMASKLPIGGSKNVLYVPADKKGWTQANNPKGTELVVSSAKAVEELNKSLQQGGVVTGQDANITQKRADEMAKAAKEVMIPHSLPGLNLSAEDTSWPTAVAFLGGMTKALELGMQNQARDSNSAKMLGQVPHREGKGNVNQVIENAFKERRAVGVEGMGGLGRLIIEAREGLIGTEGGPKPLNVLFNPENKLIWSSITELMKKWYSLGGHYPELSELEELVKGIGIPQFYLIDNDGAPYLAMVDAGNVQFAHVGNLRGKEKGGIKIYLPKALVEAWMNGTDQQKKLLRILIQREMIIAALGAFFQRKRIPDFDYDQMVAVLEEVAEAFEKWALKQVGMKPNALDTALKRKARDWRKKYARILEKRLVVWDREIAQVPENLGKNIVGGKSYQVAVLHEKDPEHNLSSFSSTAKAAIDFLKSRGGLLSEIEERLLELDTLDQDQREAFEKEIRTIIEAIPVPDAIREELMAAYERLVALTGQPLVAVRSSGRAEDIAIRSEALKHIVLGANAGQHDTFLGVKGKEEVVYYWRKAVSSLYTARVLAYRDSIILLKIFDALLQRKDLNAIIETINSLASRSDVDETTKEWAVAFVNSLDKKDLSGISSFRVHRVLVAAGLKELAEAVQKIRSDFHHLNNIAMGVTIMPMANVDVSFVGFGHDLKVDHWTALSFKEDREKPEKFLTKGRIFYVSFSHGLGEAIVAGLTTPDTYLVHVFEEKDGTLHVNILERMLGAKEAQVVYIAPVMEHLGLDRDTVEQWISWLKTEDPSQFPLPERFEEIELPALHKQLSELMEEHVSKTRDELNKMFDPPLIKLFNGDKDKIIQFIHVLIARSKDPDTTTMLTEIPSEKRETFSIPDEVVKETALLFYKRLASGYAHLVDTEGVVGENFGKKAFPLSTQRRPSNVVSDAHQGPMITLSYTYVDPADVKTAGGELLVKGIPTRNAFSGKIYPIDPNRNLNEQFAEIKEMAKKDPVVIVTDETTPDYVPTMQLENVVGVIALTGGPTSHAAVVSRELGIATVVGIESYLKQIEQQDPQKATKIRAYLSRWGNWVTVDANADEQSGLGTVYKGKIETRKRRLNIDLYRLPPHLQTKVGLIVGTTPPMRRVSKMGFYDGFSGVALMRGEFVYAEEGINPRYGIAFDHLLLGLALSEEAVANDIERRARENFLRHVEIQKQWLQNGYIKQIEDPLILEYLDLKGRGYTAELYWSQLKPHERADIQAIRKHPGEMEKLLNRIVGYSGYRKFFLDMHGGAVATMAAANNRDRNVVIVRGVDFKKNEARELIGGTVFDPEPEDATMIGERGARWLLQPANQAILRQEIRVLLQQIADGYTNLGFMFPFVATPEELKRLLAILHEEEKAFSTRLGRPIFLREVGMMVELPSNVVLADEFARILKQNQNETTQWLKEEFGLTDDQIYRKSFFSFGTNDLTQTTLGADRDNPKMRSLFNEAHPFVIDSIRHVVLIAKQFGIKCGLCGQALVNLQKVNPKAAEEILLLLGLTGGYGGTDYLGLPDAIARAAAVTLRHGVLEEAPAEEPLAEMTEASLEKGAASRSFVALIHPPQIEQAKSSEERKKKLDEYFSQLHVEAGEWVVISNQYLVWLMKLLLNRPELKDELFTKFNIAGALIFDDTDTKDIFFKLWPELRLPWLIVESGGLDAIKAIDQRYSEEISRWRNEASSKDLSEDERVALEWKKPKPPRLTVDFKNKKIYEGTGVFRVDEPRMTDPFEMPKEEIRNEIPLFVGRTVSASNFYQQHNRHPYDWVNNDEKKLRDKWNDFLRDVIVDSSGEPVIIRTMDLTSTELSKMKGHEKYTPEKEINPPLGHFGLNALVQDESGRRLLRTEFESLRDVLDSLVTDQGQKSQIVRLVLSSVRTPEAVAEARTLLNEAGITDEKINEWKQNGIEFQVGMNIAWPGNYLRLEEFILAGGLNFVLINERELAQGLLAAHLDGKNPNVRSFYHADRVRPVLSRPIAMVKNAADKQEIAVFLRPYEEMFGVGATRTAALELAKVGLRGAVLRVKQIMEEVDRLKAEKHDDMATDWDGLKRWRVGLYLLQLAAQTRSEQIRSLANKVFNGAGPITKNDMEMIETTIKDVADGMAKRLYQDWADQERVILMVRSSEGSIRDQVDESFKAADIVLPQEIAGEEEAVLASIDRNARVYRSPQTGRSYKIVNAIIDVIEGTKMFVTNADGKTLSTIEPSQSGATSAIVYGPVVAAFGNVPDMYAGQFVTNLGSAEQVEQFRRQIVKVTVKRKGKIYETYSLDDPRLYARFPKQGLKAYFEYLLKTRGQQPSELTEEIVVMSRDREKRFVDAFHEVVSELGLNEEKVTLVKIKDGTVAHGLKALMTKEQYEAVSMGQPYGPHKTMITVGGAAEAFMMLGVAGALRRKGALASVRIYSAKMNKDKSGKKVGDQSQRYAFTQEERDLLRKIRPHDAHEIIAGTKLFRDDLVDGPIYAAFSFMTPNGVFHNEGTRIKPGVSALVPVLRIEDNSGAGLANVFLDEEAYVFESPALTPLNPIKITTSGYRDTVGKRGFNRRNVYRLGIGVAQTLKLLSSEEKQNFFGPDVSSDTKLRVLVTFGPRPQAEEYARILAALLNTAGFEVVMGDDITTTPASMAMTSPSLGEDRYHVAFHVDASHNPVTDLGVKVFVRGAVAPNALAGKIRDHANSVASENVPEAVIDEMLSLQGSIERITINELSIDRYNTIFKLKEINKPPSVPIIVVDPMHGGAGKLWKILDERYPNLDLTILERRADPLAKGTYPKKVSVKGKEEPFRPEPLQAFVDREAFELFEQLSSPGSLFLATDGDADRLAVWLKTKEGVIELSPNELGVLLALYLIDSKTGLLGLPDGVRPKIITTLPTTMRLQRLAQRKGIEFIPTPVGSKHFAPYVDQGLVIAVEESGHIVVRYQGEVLFDDAVGHALLLMRMLNEKPLMDWLSDAEAIAGSFYYSREDIRSNEIIKKNMDDMMKDAETLKAWIQNVLNEAGLKDQNVSLKLKGTNKQSEVFQLPDLSELSEDHLNQINPLEGIKVEIWSQKNEFIGWFMIRFSGTEPTKLRLYTEAATQEQLKNIQTAVLKVSRLGPFAPPNDNGFGPASVGAAQRKQHLPTVDRNIIEEAVGKSSTWITSLLNRPVVLSERRAPHHSNTQWILLPDFLTDQASNINITFKLLPHGVNDRRIPLESTKIIQPEETGETFVVVSSEGKATVFIDQQYYDALKDGDENIFYDWLASVYAVAASFLYQQTKIRSYNSEVKYPTTSEYETKDKFLKSPYDVARAVYETLSELLMKGHLIYLRAMIPDWEQQLNEMNHQDGLLDLLREINHHLEFLGGNQGKVTNTTIKPPDIIANLADLHARIEQKIKNITGSASVAPFGPTSVGAAQGSGSEDKGGIDISDWLMPLQVLKDENGRPLPLEQQPLESLPIEGVVPVILDIRPVDLPLLLGLKEDRSSEEPLPQARGGIQGTPLRQQDSNSHDEIGRRFRRRAVVHDEGVS